MFKSVLMRLYGLSEEGSKVIIQAGVWEAIFQLAVLVPAILFALVVDEMLTRYFGQIQGSIPLLGYFSVSLLLLLVIFFSHKIAYRKKYIAASQEEYKLRMNLADKIRKLPLSYLGKRDLSDLTTAIMEDATIIEGALSTSVTEFIGGVLFGIISLIALFLYDWEMTLSLAICIPAAAIVMAFARKISEGTNQKNTSKKLAISDGLQEYLENIKVLRTSTKMADYQRGLEQKTRGVIGGLVLYEFLAGVTISLSCNVIRMGLGLVIITSSAALIAGEITLVKFLLFLFIAARIFEPLVRTCEKLGELIYSLVCAKRIQDIMTYPVQEGQTQVALNGYAIDFDSVYFGYNQEEIIHNVSFKAKQGEITALVGPSGCGKSTLSKLAARFWDVNRGSISIGGVNINTIAPEELLENFSIVFQDVVLFNDTIYNNIKIGKAGATTEEVLAAAKLACCDEFIANLPHGYDTVIGENGKTLSGGERQRLSIARAFLKDAPIILLDESTASIDPENETKIQSAIGKLIQNKTVLIIAHRLRSIMDCNKIIVLEAGKVLEQGTHQELITTKGLYQKLYNLQNESSRWIIKS